MARPGASPGKILRRLPTQPLISWHPRGCGKHGSGAAFLPGMLTRNHAVSDGDNVTLSVLPGVDTVSSTDPAAACLRAEGRHQSAFFPNPTVVQQQ
jgi:hypothetical protein